MKSRRFPSRYRRSLVADRAGTAVVEMAFAMPLLITMLCGVVTTGSWLGLAHAVQQSANEGARASLGGLSQTERASLARDAANQTLARTYRIDPSTVSIAVADDGSTLTVDVSYDASGNPLLWMPMVSVATRTIERRTAVKINNL